MALKVKEGVEFTIAPAGMVILQALKAISRTLVMDLTITSGSDGVHSGPNDPHKRGEAYDIRSHDIPNKELVLSMIKTELGSNFFAFLESPGTENEHFHIQLCKGMEFSLENYLEN